MFGMTKKRGDDKTPGKRYPSREKAGYLAIPLDMLEVFKEVAKKEDRSASALARKVIREFLESRGLWPRKDQQTE